MLRNGSRMIIILLINLFTILKVIQKNSGWKSYGISYEKPTIFTVDGGKKIEITNRSWWEYIFEHSAYKFSFDEMKDNYNYNVE